MSVKTWTGYYETMSVKTWTGCYETMSVRTWTDVTQHTSVKTWTGCYKLLVQVWCTWLYNKSILLLCLCVQILQCEEIRAATLKNALIKTSFWYLLHAAASQALKTTDGKTDSNWVFFVWMILHSSICSAEFIVSLSSQKLNIWSVVIRLRVYIYWWLLCVVDNCNCPAILNETVYEWSNHVLSRIQ